MAKIPVPRPAKGSFNKERPVSELLRWQLRHMHEVEKKLPHYDRSHTNVEKIKTEGEAAQYLKKVTAKLHRRGKIKIPRPVPGSFNKHRPISDLLKSQVEHFHEVEMTWPAGKRTSIDIRTIETEHEAAAYIARITAALHRPE